MAVNLWDFKLGNGFLDMTLKEWIIKEKNRWISPKVKIKNFVLQDTIKKMKRHPTEWEKTFANYISDKRHSSRII